MRDTENNGNIPDIDQAIDEALAINAPGSGFKQKITFIEHAYTWADFQPNNDTIGDIRLGGLDGLGGLKADLIKCRTAGLRLRVLLSTHKYEESFPKWIYDVTEDEDYNNRHTVIVGTGVLGPVPMVRLDQPNTLLLLENLYTKIIALLKGLGPELQHTFYGFVLQEPSHGHLSSGAPLSPSETTQWYAKLNELHDLLGSGLGGGFATGTGGRPKRLFWQMINYPDDAVITTSIVSSVQNNHGGLCGPDTFPGEPHLNWKTETSQGFEYGLANAYDVMRVARPILPISLHVYRLNYIRPYQGGLRRPAAGDPNTPAPDTSPEALEEQLPYLANSNDDDTAINDYGRDDGDDSPRGLANFLGCVPSPRSDSLKVHNVVWSMAQGATSGSNKWAGWRNVRAWMKTDNSGGCNTATPTNID